MKKKILSFFSVVFLGISTIPTCVYASDTAPVSGYQQVEKDALAKFATDLAVKYSENIENIDAALEGTYADMTFTLGDAGRSLLGMMIPVDVSWLKDLKLTTDITISDSATMETVDLLLNGTKLCTMEIMADSSTDDTYIRIPELSESYLSVNYADAMNILEQSTSVDTSSSASSLAIAGIGSDSASEVIPFYDVYNTILQNLPDSQVLENIITNYGNMLVESFEEGSSGNETLTVDNVSQDCTTYEGTLSNNQAISLIKSVLTTARDDSDIKAFFPADADSAYKDFQASLDSLLEEFPDENSSENSSLVSKIWVGEDGSIAGRQISIPDSTDSLQSILTWKNPENGSNSGFLFEINGDGSILSLSGTGSKNGTTLDGTYTLSIDTIPYLSIEVSDYDTEAAQKGNINGVYTFSILPGAVQDETTYTSVSSFSLVATLASDGIASSFTLDLQSAGASLCSLSCSSDLGEGISLPSLSEIQGTVYDSLNEEDVNAYIAELNVDTLMDNLTAAGMPDGFIDQVMALYSSTQDSYYDDYSGYDDYGDDDSYSDDGYSDDGDYYDNNAEPGSLGTYENESNTTPQSAAVTGAVAFVNNLLFF